jgi:hypothetical protein
VCAQLNCCSFQASAIRELLHEAVNTGASNRAIGEYATLVLRAPDGSRGSHGIARVTSVEEITQVTVLILTRNSHWAMCNRYLWPNGDGNSAQQSRQEAWCLVIMKSLWQ